jgi:1-deoxy-D-xylulose-5-phosphate synthase
LKCRSLMLPDCYIDHNNPMRMYDLAGLNAAQIVIQAKSLLNVGHVEIVNLKPKQAE